jgi:hypothetical protein
MEKKDFGQLVVGRYYFVDKHYNSDWCPKITIMLEERRGSKKESVNSGQGILIQNEKVKEYGNYGQEHLKGYEAILEDNDNRKYYVNIDLTSDQNSLGKNKCFAESPLIPESPITGGRKRRGKRRTNHRKSRKRSTRRRR